MKVETLIRALESPDECNETLATLYAIASGSDERLTACLVALISDPARIEDPTRFGALLASLGSSEFVKPLADMLVNADEKAPWLDGFTLALGHILAHLSHEEEEEEVETEAFAFNPKLIDRLGQWMMADKQSVLSWRAATILGNMGDPACRPYLVAGVRDTSLQGLARIECLSGLINQYGAREMSLYEELLNDPDPDFRTAVSDAIAWLSEGEDEHEH